MKTATRPTLKCLRCGYSWYPRGDVEPERIKSCPECKHRKWKEPKPPDDEPRIFENLLSHADENPQRDEFNFHDPKRTSSREYDQYRKAKMKREQTEKPQIYASALPKPQAEQHSCHDCGEPAEFSIEGTDLNYTDQGIEFITNIEWFCGEHYQKRTRDLP